MSCGTGKKQAIFNDQIVPLMQQIVDLYHTDRVHGSWVLLGEKFAGSRRLNRAAGLLLKAKAEKPGTEINLKKFERGDA